MFGFFEKKVKKEDFEQHKKAVQTALGNAKQDILNVSEWVKHLDKRDGDIKREILDINSEISTMKDEVEQLKELISVVGNPGLFKQRQTAVGKQTAVYAVQKAVQTTVQTAFFDRLSASERALVMILLNSDLKLSYEDLAAMMGKDENTIRGQINTIKQKFEGVIFEQVEKNNKKRLYIPDKIKEKLFKKVKVRVNNMKKGESSG